MPKSLMRVGIAGTSIVSAYMIIVATELRIANTSHVSRGILLPEGGGNVVICSEDDCSCDDLSDLPFL
jgi:hypothetical protein